MTLRVEDLTVALGGTTILEGVDLTVPDGHVATILGASGSGKTTLLRAIAGVIPIERGRIRVADRDITSTATHQRRIGLIFQDHALFPHLDVARNVAYPMRLAELPGTTRRERVHELLGTVGLAGFEDRAVNTLSGGEAQRVALARALAGEPDVLCLDEPLASLDRPRRAHLLDVLDDVLSNVGIPAIYVTHDRSEAFRLADELIVLHGGHVARAGTPRDVWGDPRSSVTAELVGYSSILTVAGSDGTVRRLAVALDGAEVVRPDDGRLVDAVATVQTVRFDQGRNIVGCMLDDDQTLLLAVRDAPGVGERLALRWNPVATAWLS